MSERLGRPECLRRCRVAAPLLLLLLAGSSPAEAAAPAPAAQVIGAVPGEAPVLDQNACLRVAVLANERVVAERWRRRELDGQMKQALSTGLPTLDLVGDWSRGRDPSFALDSTFGGGGGGFGRCRTPNPGSTTGWPDSDR